jgi:glycosyltransferase involved in cell wall biosynthesis
VRVAILLHKSVEYDGRVRREAAALAAAGHEVEVVHIPDGREFEMPPGIRLSSALPPAWTRRLPRTLWRILALGTIARRARSTAPDVVHANDIATLVPGYLATRLNGARLVYDTHEYAPGVPYRKAAWAWLASTLERLLIGRCAAVITVSDGIADRLQGRYGLERRPTVLRNLPDLPPPGREPQPRLRETIGVGDQPLVLHQGAVAADRGCESLVRAFAGLDSAHLLFLGADGDYAAGLERLAGELGVATRVHFHPPVPLTQLLSYTVEGDVGVSLLEDTCENHRLALPNKLFEYIAAGLPVVVSDLPEMRRLVAEREIGWLVDPGDPAGIARVLERALASREDPELHERVRRAAADLNWPRERARLIELYKHLDPGEGRGGRE